MIRDAATESDRAPWLERPAPCPWYVGAVMATHYALGSLLLLAAGGMTLAFIADVLYPSGGFDGTLAALASVFTVVSAGLGFLMLFSARSVRWRERRRLSILCGSLWFFGGPLAVFGLFTLVALSRRRAIEYYESAAEAPAFPVVPVVAR